MRTVTDVERRARLGLRHGLAMPASDAETATRQMTVLHATEAASVYLSLWARVKGIKQGDIDHALYEARSLVKQLAMRRTLFVFPRENLPAAWGSASARVAEMYRVQLTKEAEGAGLTDDGAAWLRKCERAVTRRLAGGESLSTSQLRQELPALAGKIVMSPGKKYGGEFPIAPRVLTWLGARAKVTRAQNQGNWRINRPLWASTEAWLGEVPAPLSAREGYAQLVGSWLRTFGPGTIDDIRWWLGATVTIVKQALADNRAVEVTLESGQIAWLLPDDLDPVAMPDNWGALLPVLDPTVMGWTGRGWYLGDLRSQLFDTAGNAGTTIWWNGQVHGCWVQDQEGRVRLSFLTDPGKRARRVLETYADELTAWVDSARVQAVYSTPAMKAALLQGGIRGQA
jgi:hypothetical protein